MQESADYLLCFAHGKESGPWGLKITHLAEIARQAGFSVLSPDFREQPDPDKRIAILEHELASFNGCLALVGSSMGGYVVAQAAHALNAQAMLLMAPALYFPDYDREPPECAAATEVVHGWNDEIVPVESAIRFARTHQATLHMVPDDHMLHHSIEYIGEILHRMLSRLRTPQE